VVVLVLFTLVSFSLFCKTISFIKTLTKFDSFWIRVVLIVVVVVDLLNCFGS